MASESVSCYLCGMPVRPCFSRFGGSVYECPDCFFRLLHPQPDDAALRQVYGDAYFIGHDDAGEARHAAALKRATAESYLDIILKNCGVKNPRLLEAGCGSGDFLQAAQARGCDVAGVEFSPHASANANKLLGSERVFVGTLADVPAARGPFDVVCAFDVIEHVRKPQEFLELAAKLLRPGGIVFIVTPALDSWSARVMGQRWMEYKLEHLSYFSRKSIRVALKRAGFSDVSVTSNTKTLSFDYVYQHFVRYPVGGFTPMVRLAHWLTPGFLARRPVQIVASGLAALARKS